jgi:hypothetical protein
MPVSNCRGLGVYRSWLHQSFDASLARQHILECFAFGRFNFPFMAPQLIAAPEIRNDLDVLGRLLATIGEEATQEVVGLK